jgi:hypothetical protein
MKNLLKALHAVSAEIKDPVKQSKNPAFKSKYADINAVLEVIREPLQENGLVVTQTYEATTEGKQALVTTLWHVESGESLASTFVLRPVQDTPQALGSAATYGRRYSLSALFGLGSVDDDGNEATGSEPAAPGKVPLNEALFQQAQKKLTEAKTSAEIDRVLDLTKSLPEEQKKIIQTAAVTARGRVK